MDGDKDIISATDPMARLVAEKAAEMKARREISPDRVRVRMPVDGGLDPPLAARVVEHCLLSVFSIAVPRAARAQMKLGAETEFEDRAVPELPPRKVRIVPGEKGFCEVTGVPPEHGRDSRAEVRFEWRKRSGRIKPDGSIDWKDINSVPNVNEGDLLAEIHDRTTGVPGVDAFGRALKPRPGKRHPVRWMKERIVAEQDRDGGMYRLFAACSGVVRFEFREPDRPETLQSLEITDSLTINGDIDYDYGNLESAASLEIRGSLRGAFSLRSEGHVHVQGAIEGREIEAAGISAELITNGCRVHAKREVEAGSLTNCEIEAGEVRVATSASSAGIRAGRVVFGRDCAVMATKVRADAVLFEQAVFSGRVEIDLGGEIFTRADEATDRLAGHEKISDGQAGELREAARDLLARCLGIETAMRGFRPDSVPARLFVKLKQILAEAFRNTRHINELATSLAYELQDVLGDHGLPEGTLRKLDQVVARIREYNNLCRAFAERREMMEEERRTLAGLREAARGLEVRFDRAVSMTPNAEVLIRCGDAGLRLEAEEIPKDGVLTVTYRLPDETEDLRHGILAKGRG